jgi:hypothetical protein
MQSSSWQTQSRFLEMRTRWLTLLGEHLIDDQSQSLEYWRIEKADSVILLPRYQQHLLLPPPAYRPGIGQSTWDFPGGRIPEGQAPALAAPAILQRELGIQESAIAQLTPLNPRGWPVNSSFSNQCLYGFVADLEPTTELAPTLIGKTVPADASGVQALLQVLTCLQCRALLLQWWFDQGTDPSAKSSV